MKDLWSSFCEGVTAKITVMRELEVQRAKDAKQHAELAALVQRLSLDLQKSEAARLTEASRHEEAEREAAKRHQELLAAITSRAGRGALSAGASGVSESPTGGGSTASTTPTSNVQRTAVSDDKEDYRSIENPAKHAMDVDRGHSGGGAAAASGSEEAKKKKKKNKNPPTCMPRNSWSQTALSAFSKLASAEGNLGFQSWVDFYTLPTISRKSWNWMEEKEHGNGLWRAKCADKIRTLATRHLRIMKVLLVLKETVPSCDTVQKAAEWFDSQKFLLDSTGKMKVLDFADKKWKDLKADEGNSAVFAKVEKVYGK